MTQLDTLHQHQQVCDELYQCVLDENRHLRQHMTAPDRAHLQLKQALLERLDRVLDKMRKLPAKSAAEPAVAAQIEKGRTRILQILQLERENEDLLRRCGKGGARMANAGAPTAGMLQKIYARSC
jgi:hypothetical protein